MARLLAMPGAIGLLAVQNADPCAFLLARRVADEAEILTLGTRPFARRRGAAKLLIEQLQSKIAQKGAHALYIEVALGNTPARQLYRAFGFVDAGLRKSYYEKPGGMREDAVVMRKDLVA